MKSKDKQWTFARLVLECYLDYSLDSLMTKLKGRFLRRNTGERVHAWIFYRRIPNGLLECSSGNVV